MGQQEIIQQTMKAAHLPCLLVALANITGNADHLTDDLRAVPMAFGDPKLGGLSEEKQAHVRRLASEIIAKYVEAGRPPLSAPNDELQHRMINFLLGPVSDEYMPYVLDALSAGSASHRKPQHYPIHSTRTRVLIIGAGASGLLMAIRLQEAGILFEIIEKNPDVGGTWFDNTYPGCRVDTENHTYCYSFEPHRWPQHYSRQPVLLDYFKSVAEKYDLRRHIHFGMQVLSAEYDERRSVWTVTARAQGGDTKTFQANAIVSAVGQLNQPKFPDIKGRDSFKGPSFHSARWRHDVGLRGKRVAVVGSGASAFQFIPEIANTAQDVIVFQRSPTYLIPTPDYHDDVSTGERWLFDNVPGYADWYRLWLFWIVGSDGAYALVRRDPNWKDTDSVNEGSKMVRALLLEKLREQTGNGRLYDALMPEGPVWSKRVLRDNGLWVRTLKRDNVALITDPIAEITTRGVVSETGQEYPVDVIIYGTGFHADEFLRDVKVVGRAGRELHQVWDGDPKAYLGMTVPGFPNFFMMYGPNTNIVVNISILFFSECAANYIVKCLDMLSEHNSAAIDLKPEVFDAFARRVDETSAHLAWCVPNVLSWYKNAKGLSSQNWPFRQIEYWVATRAPNPLEYEFFDPTQEEV